MRIFYLFVLITSCTQALETISGCSDDGVECYTQADGADYRGYKAITENGNTCQKWSSQTPHWHFHTPDAFPNADLGDHNYCRNPDGESKAWCFTTNPNVIWESCDIGQPQELCPIGGGVKGDDSIMVNITVGAGMNITSPFYPSNYPNNSCYDWTITTCDSCTLRLQILKLDIGISDKLTLMESGNAVWTANSLGKGQLHVEHIQLLVTFKTESSLSYSGFVIEILSIDSSDGTSCPESYMKCSFPGLGFSCLDQSYVCDYQFDCSNLEDEIGCAYHEVSLPTQTASMDLTSINFPDPPATEANYVWQITAPEHLQIQLVAENASAPYGIFLAVDPITPGYGYYQIQHSYIGDGFPAKVVSVENRMWLLHSAIISDVTPLPPKSFVFYVSLVNTTGVPKDSLCADDEYMCSDINLFIVCLEQRFLCDEIAHCPSVSDEDERTCFECSEDRFDCKNGDCILLYRACDGYDDCSNGRDEKTEICGETSTTATTIAPSTVDATTLITPSTFDVTTSSVSTAETTTILEKNIGNKNQVMVWSRVLITAVVLNLLRSILP